MFTQTELDFIKQAAKAKKNQGELAVAKYIIDLNGHWYGPWDWTETKLDIIKYCAEECKRQHSGEMSVYDMVVAWDFADNLKVVSGENLTLATIEYIGKLVEPNDNRNGFRSVPIGIWDGFIWKEKANWERVPELLEILIQSYYEGYLVPNDVPTHPLSKTAEDEFYFNYEEIHPFFDGNGRSGKILYNYLKGTLENPIMPPNFWGGNNP